MSSHLSHLVILSACNWGDLRPTCGLSVTLARKFPQYVISLIVDVDFCGKAQAELGRHCISTEEEKTLLPRIRCISLGRIMEGMTPKHIMKMAEMDPRENHALPAPIVQRINSAMPSILADEELTDDLGVKWSSVGTKPSVIISDFLMARVAIPMKEQSIIPIVLWVPWPATSFSRNFAPSEFGGQAEEMVLECEEIWEDTQLRNGRSFSQIMQDASNVWEHSRKAPDVVNVKGLPPYYKWENCPQVTWWKPLVTLYDGQHGGMKLSRCADGVMLATVPELEPESTEDVRQWFSGQDVHRRLFYLGPQIPLSYHMDCSSDNERAAFGKQEVLYYDQESSGNKSRTSESIDPSVAFLDKALEVHGRESALYISFGTLYFPQPSHVRILIETLLELEQPMPFVFSIAAKASANPDADIPGDLLAKLKTTGRGIIVDWAPQQAVLSHPAMGWIVTHCGSNGTLESLSFGIPTIAWPFMGDQPVNALWMSETLDTGFELLQVRTGPGAKHRAYRGGPDGTQIIGTDDAVREELRRVLSMCRGHVGSKKRVNAQRVRDLIATARKEGGSVDSELNAFGKWLEVS